MFFLRKKKQRQDQDVGLVFRWRGARRHHVGKALALALTIVLFAFATYAIRVEGMRTPLLTKRTGEVVMLHENDPHSEWLLLQVEERSPFPLRWDPAFDSETIGRISTATNLLSGPVWDYQPSLVEVPRRGVSLRLPSISEDKRSFFSETSQNWNESADAMSIPAERSYVNLRVSAKIVADKEIQGRLPLAEFPLPADLIGDEWYGRSFRFLVGVDSLGVVRGCLPLSGSSMDVAKPTERQKLLSIWLLRMLFKASDDIESPTSIGVLELQIEAREE